MQAGCGAGLEKASGPAAAQAGWRGSICSTILTMKLAEHVRSLALRGEGLSGKLLLDPSLTMKFAEHLCSLALWARVRVREGSGACGVRI